MHRVSAGLRLGRHHVAAPQSWHLRVQQCDVCPALYASASKGGRQFIESGAFPLQVVPASTQLIAIKDAAARIYAAGDVLASLDALALNFLLDRDAAHRNSDLAKLKTELGPCTTLEAVNATAALEGEAIWTCERGRLRAKMLLAPTVRPSLQTLEWERMN